MLDADLATLPVCDLRTVGRVTGRPHVVELWFAAAPDKARLFILAGSREEADWVRNVRRNPAVQVRLGDQWYAGVATEIEHADDDEQLARRLLAAKYQGWKQGARLSSWARHSLPIAVDLER